MELDTLKRIWKKQKGRRNYEYSRSELIMFINNKMISFEEKIRSRDRLEIIACIVIIICFGITFFTTESIWKQVGSGAIILSGIFIWYKLKSTQAQTINHEPSPDRPMREYLELELQSIRKQKKLLRNVAWWYILPMDVGLFLFTLGFNSGLITKLIYLAVVVLFSIFVWKINQRAAKRKFDPLLREINEAIQFVEEESDY